MKLTDWRGGPVIPDGWLHGYLAVHPIYAEHRPTGGPWQIGQKQVYRLEAALKKRREDGRGVGIFMNGGRCLSCVHAPVTKKLTFFLNGNVDIQEC